MLTYTSCTPSDTSQSTRHSRNQQTPYKLQSAGRGMAMHTCPKTSLLYRVYERSAVVDLRCYNLQGVCPVNVAVSSSSPQLPPNQSSTLKRVDNHHHSCT